ncbi:Transmembrane osmosensor, variant 2 [Entomophthora muscae]|uniref:Transmembrane osmosensor, variant 2 n=1 Tax=Entomophthora muscae TaxID=34485 RepID=A0ACC2T7I0_9FUNG|nr:Transmembrane osmosensor, variant 2 [Entomophthora muscae]
MPFRPSNLYDTRFYCVTTFSSTLGCLLVVGGLAKDLEARPYNHVTVEVWGGFGLLWFLAAYLSLLILTTFFYISRDKVVTFRLPLIASKTVGFVFGILGIKLVLDHGTQASLIAASGFALINVSLSAYVVVFGKDDQTKQMNHAAVHPSYIPNGKNNGAYGFKIGPSPLIAKKSLSGPQSPTCYYSRIQSPLPPISYPLKACALYTYKANPEDPKELSFYQGEILDVSENRGKWWQARKADMSVGIAPSNYVSFLFLSFLS